MATRRQRFAAARKAAGHTQESLAAELGVDRTTIVRWEAGDTEPQPFYWPKLARLLGITPVELRQLLAEPADGATPAAPAAATVELLGLDRPVLDRRSVLLGSAAAALALGDAETLRRQLADAVDHAAMSEASLDDWERTIQQYGLAFSYRSAASLLVDLTADFAELRRLLERRRSILVPTRLTRIVAQMAGLMCAVLNRLGEQIASRSWARIARAAAHEAGDSKLHAWILSEDAYSHYYGGNLVEAASVAAFAQHVAKGVACSGVAQTAALEARVYALHDRSREADDALDRAERALGGLDPHARIPAIFCYHEAKLMHHTGSAYTYLGRTAAAAGAQERALALYPKGDHFNRSLVMLDRAECLVCDDVPAATEWVTQALRTTAMQGNPVIDNRAHQIFGRIPAKAASLPAVQELRELIHDTAAR